MDTASVTGRRFGVVGQIVSFLGRNKRWWLLPIVVMLLLMIVFIIFGGNSAIAPFTYTLF